MARGLAVLALLAAGLIPARGASWGREGHALILEHALSLLPEAERSIYSGRRAELERWLAEPDKHHSLPTESSRHWLDLEKLRPGYISRLKNAVAAACPGGECADEHLRDISASVDAEYFKISPAPLPPEQARPLWDSLPSDYRKFREIFGGMEIAVGSVVYQPALYAAALVRARAEGDLRSAAKYAGLLSHYSADVFEPFHLTANYRGQYSGNLYFRHEERGDLHARFETGFVNARAGRIASALAETSGPPVVPIGPDSTTGKVIAAARHAYGLLPALIEADRDACARADPRRKWQAYLRAADPVFRDICVRQMDSASRLLAGILLAARPEGDSSPAPISGKMKAQ